MISMKLATNPAGEYDISFTPQGGIEFVQGIDEIEQNIITAIYFVKGDWFLDLESGLDYANIVFKKGVSEFLVNNQFIETILGVNGVISILEFEASLDAADRVYSISFSAATNAGTVALSNLTFGGIF